MNSLYGNFRQRKFTDIFESADDFLTAYKDTSVNGLYSDSNKISDANAKILFYLIYSRYGNSVIASSDENRFKYNVWALIFQYGPTWEKRLSIQSDLRSLTGDALLVGSKMVYNHAYNPSQPVNQSGTSTVEELLYINEQNTQGTKKSKMDAYALLLGLIETDVTGEFLDKFKKLFLTIVEPELPLWYVTEETEEED